MPGTGSRALAGVMLALTWPLLGAGAAPAPRVTLRIWYATDDPVERAWSQDLARRFQATHRSISVRLTDYRFDDLNAQLPRAISTANAPDLAYVSPREPGIPAYVRTHALADLSAPARVHRWHAVLRPGLLQAYNAPFRYGGAWSRALGAQAGTQGAIFAVPTEIAGVAVLYNRRLLARLHLGVPASLAQFTSALAAARRAHLTSLGIGNEDGWPGDDLFDVLADALATPSSLDAEQRLDSHFSFREQPYLTAASLIRQWADAGYVTEDLGANDAQEAIDLFFQGQTLFQVVSSSEASQIAKAQQTTRIPIGVFAFPGTHGRVAPQSGYLGWVVPAKSPHRAQAIQFISDLLSASTARFLARHDRLPAHAGSASPAGATAWQRALAHAILTARPAPYLDDAPMPHLQSTMQWVIQNLLHRRISAATAMSALQEAYSSHGRRGGGIAVTGEF